MIQIRPAQTGDTPAVKALEDECLSPAWSVKQLSDELSCEDTVFLVAESGGSVAGFLILRRAGGDAELFRIAVSPSLRRKGVGSALLSGAASISSELGLDRIFLEVRAGNAPAKGLYQKHGFSEAGIRKGYYDSPSEDAVIMSLEVQK